GDRERRRGSADHQRTVRPPTLASEGLPRLRARDPGGSSPGAAVRVPRRRLRSRARRLHRSRATGHPAIPAGPGTQAPRPGGCLARVHVDDEVENARRGPSLDFPAPGRGEGDPARLVVHALIALGPRDGRNASGFADCWDARPTRVSWWDIPGVRRCRRGPSGLRRALRSGGRPAERPAGCQDQGHLTRVPAVDQPSTTRLNSLFGLSFETVTALRGGHFAHRPCRDLVTAAALRPGTYPM